MCTLYCPVITFNKTLLHQLKGINMINKCRAYCSWKFNVEELSVVCLLINIPTCWSWGDIYKQLDVKNTVYVHTIHWPNAGYDVYDVVSTITQYYLNVSYFLGGCGMCVSHTTCKQKQHSGSTPGLVVSLRYIVAFWLVEMTISTN